MAVINKVLVEVSHIVARVVERQVNQSGIISGETTSTSPAASAIPTTLVATTPTNPSPSPTGFQPTGTGNTGSNPGGSSGSSPLLFFVALGFGVVFTNLW
jgi:hypothetical protein